MKGFFSKANINNIIMLIVALSLCIGFSFLIINDKVTSGEVLSAFMSLCVFYFGTSNKQSEDKKK